MRSPKSQKIDLTSEYPCPCRRKGRLKPIVLTEALGCDRCQEIFAVKKDGQVIEQLSSIYQKKSWRWTGNRWRNAYARWTQSNWSKIAFSALVLTAILPFVLRWLNEQSIILGAVLFFISVILLVLTLFLYRH